MKKNRKRFFLKMSFNILCFVQLCACIVLNRPKSDIVPQSITISGTTYTGKFNHWSFSLTAQNRTRIQRHAAFGVHVKFDNLISAGTLQNQLRTLWWYIEWLLPIKDETNARGQIKIGYLTMALRCLLKLAYLQADVSLGSQKVRGRLIFLFSKILCRQFTPTAESWSNGEELLYWISLH